MAERVLSNKAINEISVHVPEKIQDETTIREALVYILKKLLKG